jgi:hypothetical protein
LQYVVMAGLLPLSVAFSAFGGLETFRHNPIALLFLGPGGILVTLALLIILHVREEMKTRQSEVDRFSKWADRLRFSVTNGEEE